MAHARRKTKFDNLFKAFIFLAILIFGTTIYYLSNDFTYIADSVNVRYLTDSGDSSMKTVELVNSFDCSITIHYDDGETGLYLTTLDKNERIKVSAAIGQGLYVTEPNGWERLDYIAIRPDIKTYIFSPHIQNAVLHKQLNVDKRVRKHPLIVDLHGAIGALSTRFKSLSGRNVELWFNDGRDGILQGHLHQGQETTTCSYPGHRFFITESGHKDHRITEFLITQDRVIYYIEDAEHPASPEVMHLAEKEKQFMAEYYNRTGIQWRHYFGQMGPRPPPKLYMWPAKEIGDVHRVISKEGYWNCTESKEKCQSSNLVKLELEVLSIRPRAFMIENFLSQFEASEIVRMASPRLHHSSVGDAEVGAFESDTRTSDNSWISRGSSPVINSLFLRAADLLQVDEKLLHRSQNAEEMQVVHYVHGQKYEAHHDWGVSGYPESRYITLLLYLTDMASPNAGGETSFPKGGNGQGFKVQPKKGNAVLFYNLLEDGNGDDLALHAALPVMEGEKWLANFWVWDPKIK